MFTLREFEPTDADYAAMGTIVYALFPDFAMSPGEWKHYDETRAPQYIYRRVMVEHDGRIVAFGDYGQVFWNYHPHKFMVNLYVQPGYDTRAIGDLFLVHVCAALADRAPQALFTATFEDLTDQMDFLLGAGFTETMRDHFLALDVTTFEAARFAHVPGRMQDQQIAILTVSELSARDPQWQPKLHRLYGTLLQDVPAPGETVERSVEEFTASTLAGPNFVPEAWFVALDGQQLVGMSRGWFQSSDAETFHNELTGVLRSHRRRGIATALKLRLIDFAQRHGVKTIHTANEPNNPMYDLNLKLGFQPRPAWVYLEKTLQR